MTKKYNIDNDFDKAPVMNIRFSRVVIGLLNLMIMLTRGLKKTAAGVTIAPRTVLAQDGRQVKLRVITPDNVQPNAPVLIYYHGGAFAMTFASLHLDSAAEYAKETGCIAVVVCYRLAMKNPFPDGFDDAFSALHWVVEHADELGVDKTRIAVGGDSAGGALAAGVAQKSRDEKLVQLCGQMLIYPVLDNRCTTASATDFVDVPLWNAVSNRRMWDMYLRRFDGSAPPAYAAPGLGDARDLPPTYVETAEFDPLRDEGLNYANLLSSLGNQPVINATSGTIHGYDGLAKSEIAIASMQQRIAFLKTVFA